MEVQLMTIVKHCPKCGSYDILYAKGSAESYGAGSNIMCGLTTYSAVDVDRYICGNCGYIEHFVREADIERLRSSKKIKSLIKPE